MRWVVKYALVCVAVVLAIVGLLWLLDEQGTLGLGTHGVIALALGIAFSAGLAALLMGLVFHSARGGHDEPPQRTNTPPNP